MLCRTGSDYLDVLLDSFGNKYTTIKKNRDTMFGNALEPTEKNLPELLNVVKRNHIGLGFLRTSMQIDWES
jgi:phosphomannomutase